MTATMTDERLLLCLNAAHEASALRHNISHEALILATVGSGSYLQAITAAMMTLGGAHAPLVETCLLLQADHPEDWVAGAVLRGTLVPGWGNGFVKDGPDPFWEELDQTLRDDGNAYIGKVDAVTTALHAQGKMIYPNPSCYTAVVALTLGLPPAASPYLFLAARLPKWTQEYCRVMGGGR